MKVKTQFATYDDVNIDLGRYTKDLSLAIRLWNEKDGMIATLTVCLNDPDLQKNEAYVDENNCPWAMEFINEYGLGSLTGKVKRSGYCMYPAVLFNMEALEGVA